MLKTIQARLQQYMNSELPDVQTGFRKARVTRDQIAIIRWIIEKAGEYQKNIYFCLLGNYLIGSVVGLRSSFTAETHSLAFLPLPMG